MLALILAATVLGEMAPYSSCPDRINEALRYAVANSEGGLTDAASECRADLQHVSFGQLRAWMCLTSGHAIHMEPAPIPVARRVSSLGIHIGDVVGLRSQEEMGHVDAWPVVATVQDAESVRNVAMGNLPGESMRTYAALGSEGLRSDPDSTVSVPVASAQEDVALFQSRVHGLVWDGAIPVNEGAKSNFVWYGLSSHLTSSVSLVRSRQRANVGDSVYYSSDQSHPPEGDGPPLDPAAPVTVKLASDFGGELFRITLGAGLDLLSTGWALSRCPTCFEGNVAGPNADARFGLKVGGAAVAAAVCWQAEKRGHHNFAKGLSWGVFVAQLAATASNTVHAIQRR